MKWYHQMVSWILGRNLRSTPVNVIVDQMNTPRPLPMGRKEFEDWSDRIISGAILPGGAEDKEAFIDSQKFTLCGTLMHIAPTESHKADAYFIHVLRKAAVNQVAHAVSLELQAKMKERKLKEEAQ